MSSSSKVKQFLRIKELTGRHVLFMLLAFFGIMLAVNIYFTYMAVTSFRGEDVLRSYRQGLEYNQTLDSRARQIKLGWTVSANVETSRRGTSSLIIKITDAQAKGVEGLLVKGGLAHRVDSSLDVKVNWVEKGDGVYVGELGDIQGPFVLKAFAQSDDNSLDVNIFRFEYAFVVG